MKMTTKPNIKPENMSVCSSTGKGHIWIWDEDQDDWYCDECGVYHERQEDENT